MCLRPEVMNDPAPATSPVLVFPVHKLRTVLPGVLAGALALHALTFAMLAVDVAWRVWLSLPPAPDVAILIGFELGRAGAIILMVVVAWALAATSRASSARWPLMLLALFAAVAYGQFFSFAGYPGHLQERAARALLANGIPRELLRLLYGKSYWSLWLAAGALMHLALIFPRDVESADIRASEGRDRRGMLRSVALAGTDVGAAARQAVGRAFDGNALTPALAWTAAITFAAAAALPPTSPLVLLHLTAAAATLGVLITILRARSFTTEGAERTAIAATSTACALAVAFLAAAAVIDFALPALVGAGLSAMLIVLAPPAAALVLLRGWRADS